MLMRIQDFSSILLLSSGKGSRSLTAFQFSTHFFHPLRRLSSDYLFADLDTCSSFTRKIVTLMVTVMVTYSRIVTHLPHTHSLTSFFLFTLLFRHPSLSLVHNLHFSHFYYLQIGDISVLCRLQSLRGGPLRHQGLHGTEHGGKAHKAITDFFKALFPQFR